eukprot:2312671-Prymnesium_polylepis.2
MDAVSARSATLPGEPDRSDASNDTFSKSSGRITKRTRTVPSTRYSGPNTKSSMGRPTKT